MEVSSILCLCPPPPSPSFAPFSPVLPFSPLIPFLLCSLSSLFSLFPFAPSLSSLPSSLHSPAPSFTPLFPALQFPLSSPLSILKREASSRIGSFPFLLHSLSSKIGSHFLLREGHHFCLKREGRHFCKKEVGLWGRKATTLRPLLAPSILLSTLAATGSVRIIWSAHLPSRSRSRSRPSYQFAAFECKHVSYQTHQNIASNLTFHTP